MVSEWEACKDASWFAIMSAGVVALGLVAWRGVMSMLRSRTSHRAGANQVAIAGWCCVVLHHALGRIFRIRRSPPLLGTRYLHPAINGNCLTLRRQPPHRPHSRAGATKARAGRQRAGSMHSRARGAAHMGPSPWCSGQWAPAGCGLQGRRCDRRNHEGTDEPCHVAAGGPVG